MNWGPPDYQNERMTEPMTYFHMQGVDTALCQSLQRHISHEQLVAYLKNTVTAKVARSSVTGINSEEPIIVPLETYKGFVNVREINNIIVRVDETHSSIRTLPSLRKAIFILDMIRFGVHGTTNGFTLAPFKHIVMSYLVDSIGDVRRDIAEMDYTFIYEFDGSHQVLMIKNGIMFDGVLREDYVDHDSHRGMSHWLFEELPEMKWLVRGRMIGVDFTTIEYRRYTDGPYFNGEANSMYDREDWDIAIATKRLLDFLRKSEYGLADPRNPSSSKTEAQRHVQLMINTGYVSQELKKIVSLVLAQAPGSMKVDGGPWGHIFKANKDFIDMMGEDLRKSTVRPNSKGEYWLSLAEINELLDVVTYQDRREPHGLRNPFDFIGMEPPRWPYTYKKPMSREERLDISESKGYIVANAESKKVNVLTDLQETQIAIILGSEYLLNDRLSGNGYTHVSRRLPSTGERFYLSDGSHYVIEPYVREKCTVREVCEMPELMPIQAALLGEMPSLTPLTASERSTFEK